MPLSKDDVQKIAFLARIRVPEERLDAIAGELNGIIGWVEQLAEVETGDVEPMTSVVAMPAPLRDDVVTDGAIADKVTANAPDPIGPFYAVPKVVE
ncbi:MAG: Asp-tRNA(Asn)/Glu-tRNA(Gln) amidotransferase subunit GatC [Proteobacteria bacterium]|nr:Asp-tRNA(Asn)/Glu-tRNA(Gln) amidotransferase subunit GatC [Pseudomonadota bacterium]